MIVLGITDSITSGATLVADGTVLSAVSEERLNRKKMAMGFPRKSISEVLRVASVDMSDVDHVAVATNTLFWRPEAELLKDYFREPKGGMARDLFLASGSFFARLTGGHPFSRRVYYGLKGFLTRKRKEKIREELREGWGYDGDMSFVDHHLAHCASAYFTSDLDEATVISLDGAGDGCSSHVYRVRDGDFKLLGTVDSYDSVGNYYAYVTHLCGFKAHRHEGKITGLAAHGNNGYLDILRRYIDYRDFRIRNIGGCFDWSAIKKLEGDLGKDFDKAELASSIQTILEEVVTAFVDDWVGKSGFGKVGLAGGVCANVKLNQRIHELDRVDSVCVHPGMGDEGLATGAALLRCFEICREKNIPFEWGQIDNVFWGAGFSDSEVEQALGSSGLSFERVQSVEKDVAALLADGHIVARFGGRMEYGPRALGNRSILYQPTDVTVNEWLNKKLKRTEFMPFAPVTLKEHTDQCYKNMDGARVPANFMTITFDCTPWMQETCPAVVHVDGTARPQVIEKSANPIYYGIVDEYRKLTGLPSIINTSFNIHEEPIVCSVDEAIRAFQEGHLEYLSIENFLVKAPDRT